MYASTYVGGHRGADRPDRPPRTYKPRHADIEVPLAVKQWRAEQGLPPIEVRS